MCVKHGMHVYRALVFVTVSMWSVSGGVAALCA
jgi:hypothetical protein